MWPIIAAFTFFVAYREKLMKENDLKTVGLFGAHGEKWFKVRRLVQQDMMRLKSAMFYIGPKEEISAWFCDVIEDRKDPDNDKIDDIAESC